jgi:hypothetical protein
MISCGCGDKKCLARISLDNPRNGSLFVTLENRERYASMYLDANGVVQLIHDLRRALLEMTDDTVC